MSLVDQQHPIRSAGDGYMASRRNRGRKMFVLESLEIRTAPSHHGPRRLPHMW